MKKIIIRLFIVLVSFIILYLSIAVILSIIPVNKISAPVSNTGIDIYLMTNGVHTDIVLPLNNQYYNWANMIHPENAGKHADVIKYVAFGWGNRDFYLNPSGWSALPLKTAFKAAFYLGQSVMHITLLEKVNPDAQCKRISITATQYVHLVKQIIHDFQKDQQNRPLLIPTTNTNNKHVHLFYQAKGRYSLFYTCNTWTNIRLKQSGLKAALWTPFAQGVFWQYNHSL